MFHLDCTIEDNRIIATEFPSQGNEIVMEVLFIDSFSGERALKNMSFVDLTRLIAYAGSAGSTFDNGETLKISYEDVNKLLEGIPDNCKPIS